MVAPDTLYKAHLAHVEAIYSAALAAAGFEALVIGSGFPHRQFLDDMHAPYYPNPHFKYWAPLEKAPGSFIVFKPGNKPKLLFLQPEDYWHKPPETPNEPWVECFDLHIVRTPQEAQAQIPQAAVFIGEAFHGQDTFGFKAANPATLLAQVHYARAVKTPYELACLRQASRIAARGHDSARASFAAGLSEYHTHLAYLAATGHMESELPYHNIIAHNDAAAILHYTELRRQPAQPLKTLLIDAGGQYRGYAADVTRTHTVDTGVFGELHARLDGLEQQLCAMVVPGVSYPSIHEAAHAKIAEALCALKIITCSVDAALERGLTRVFFPHGIGHLLGLQVHDIGGHQTDANGTITPPPANHPFLRLTRPLEAGVVVTIEPGIYFIPMLLNQARQAGLHSDLNLALIETLLPLGGVRIEDNVVATAEGAVNLTREVLAF
jgi:Xaa-Pro dipeptidase